jgi:neuralized-like protein 4
LNPKWTSSLILGVIEGNPEKITFPFNALGFKKACWLVIGDSVFHNGVRTTEKIDVNLDTIKSGQSLKLLIDSHNTLHLYCGDKNCVVAKNVNPKSRALIVMYGEAEQVSFLQFRSIF